MSEVLFYPGEIRALVACMATDKALGTLCGLHMTADGRRVWATNGHVLVLRAAKGTDIYEAADVVRVVDRQPLAAAASIAEACKLERSESIVVRHHESEGQIVAHARVSVGDAVVRAPYVAGKPAHAWAVIPAADRIGAVRAHCVGGQYLAAIATISEAIKAREGEASVPWLLAFAGQKGRPKKTVEWQPLVCRHEGLTHMWVFIAMPMRGHLEAERDRINGWAKAVSP